MTTRQLVLTTLAASVLACARLAAQVQTEVPPVVPGAKPVTVERVKVHGAALEGNLEGDAVDRDVDRLPAAELREGRQRAAIPSSTRCTAIRSAPSSGRRRSTCRRRSRARSPRAPREMIVVLPDSKTVHNGSMYSSSVTTGDFERFVAHDVVAYVDAHYRTIPERASRGLVGHSMGGYGADAHRHEAPGRVRQPLHHEPVLPLGPRSRTGRTRTSRRRSRR